MVSSGLTENVTVSHYRLSLHLLMAFIILSNLIWIYLNMKGNKNINFFNFKKHNILILFFVFMIFIQIILGAFVSGLDAGRLYQTWPKMNNSYFPDDFVLKNVGNFLNFSNASLVQFYHRITAYLIFILFIVLGFNILFRKKIHLYKSYLLVFIFLAFQILLGIFTLTSGLNIYLASLHQIGSIFLLISSLSLYNNELVQKL
jgi:cytochrome c oxidase assembly protein subunit 15